MLFNELRKCKTRFTFTLKLNELEYELKYIVVVVYTVCSLVLTWNSFHYLSARTGYCFSLSVPSVSGYLGFSPESTAMMDKCYTVNTC